jgi:hypothetical protein
MTERDIPDNWSSDQAGEPIGFQPNYISNNQTADTAAIGANSQSMKKSKKPDGTGLAINDNSESTFNLSVLIEKLPPWTKNWVVWAAVLTLIPGSMVFSLYPSCLSYHLPLIVHRFSGLWLVRQ